MPITLEQAEPQKPREGCGCHGGGAHEEAGAGCHGGGEGGSCSNSLEDGGGFDGAEMDYGKEPLSQSEGKNANVQNGSAATKFLSKSQVEKLQNAKYAMVGSHSAVQICSWNKKSIRQEGVCYKQKFYGIECDRCAQMSPTVLWCNENCVFCWRPMEWMRNVTLDDKNVDSPKDIIEGTIVQRKKLLTGFKGNPEVNNGRFERSQLPSHWAISLSGEPTLYPYICEMIAQIRQLPTTKSVFLVTNAQKTEVFEKMATNPQFLPTQLYVSLDAPDEGFFRKINRSVHADGWQKLMKSLEAISTLGTRKLNRITLMKGINDDPSYMKAWSDVVWKMKPEFVEVKSYMHIGDSRKRLSRDNMPTFDEVKAWSEKFCAQSGYVYRDFSRPSRICLLVRPDLKDRNTKIEFARKEMGIRGEGIDF